MYTDNLIRTWNFEQQDLLDVREVLYQEALVKIANLEYELKLKTWELNTEKQWCSFWSESYDRLFNNVFKSKV